MGLPRMAGRETTYSQRHSISHVTRRHSGLIAELFTAFCAAGDYVTMN